MSSLFSTTMLVVGFPIAVAMVSSLFMEDKPVANVEPVHVDTEWGTVEQLDFLHSSKTGAYFAVKTDTLFFEELDITDFPDGKIAIGDRIRLRESLTPHLVTTLYCRDQACRTISLCYDDMACFVRYQDQIKQLFTPPRPEREHREPRSGRG